MSLYHYLINKIEKYHLADKKLRHKKFKVNLDFSIKSMVDLMNLNEKNMYIRSKILQLFND